MIKRLKSTAHNLAHSYLSSIRRKRDARVGMFLCAAVAIIITIALVANYFKEGMISESGALILNGLFYIGWLMNYFIQKYDSGRVLIQPPNLKYALIGIPLAFFAILFFLNTYTAEENKLINEYYVVIESNFESIKNLPGAERLPADDIDSMKKSNLVHIGRDFISDASYDDIKSYYIAELRNEGWEFISEESIKDWGKDKGEKALNFKKDEMKLVVSYIPPNLQEVYGCNFGISISWEFR